MNFNTKTLHTTVLCLLCSVNLLAQQGVTTFGVQFKPLLNSSFFRAGKVSANRPPLSFTTEAIAGRSVGMVIRHGIDKRFSFEGGINLVNRDYIMLGESTDTNLTFTSEFRWVSYEIPLQLLVNVRLGKKIFLNTAGGLSLDFFPSDVQSINADNIFYHRSYRRSWIKPALIANIGSEYRTEKRGYFYFGASYHQTFGDMTVTQFREYYQNGNPPAIVAGSLNGSYLTIDFRYFFYEDPQKSIERKRQRELRRKNKPRDN